MLEVRQTVVFGNWIDGLRDVRAVAKIDASEDQSFARGNFGDSKSVGGGVSELRIDYGPGYRVYFSRAGDKIVILLCGGDKSTQSKDINRAKALALEGFL